MVEFFTNLKKPMKNIWKSKYSNTFKMMKAPFIL